MSGKNLNQKIWEEISSENNGEIRIKELDQTLSQLAAFTVSVPSREETSTLISNLSPYLEPDQPLRLRKRILYSEKSLLEGLIGLVMPQVRILENSFWLATFIIMTIGVFVSPFSPDRIYSLVLTAPLLAALGTCYAFRGISDGTYELERTCPVSPTLIALARLFLVVSYDILLGLLASLALWFWQPSHALGFIIISWLAPLMFFTGLALVLTIRLGSVVGYVMTIFLWILQVILRETRGGEYSFALPGSVYWLEIKLALTVVGLVFLIYGIWIYRQGKVATGGLGYGD